MENRQRTCSGTKGFAVVMICIIAFALASLAYAPQAQAATQTVTITGTYNQTAARSILGKINSFRTGKKAWCWNKTNTKKVTCKGLKKLKYDYGLEKIAMTRAMEHAILYGHTRPDGTAWSTALPNRKDVHYAENLGAEHSSAAEAHNSWLEADKKYSGQGHRRNMLDSDSYYVGIACVKINGVKFWAEEFSKHALSTKATKALNAKGSESIKIKNPKYGVALSSNNTINLELLTSNNTSKALPKATAYIKSTGGPLDYVSLSYSTAWTSLAPSVAKVSSKKAVAVKAGTATFKATCSKTGKSASVKVNVKAHTHKWGSWNITKKATCTTTGSKKHVCTKNKAHSETQTIPATGHASVTDKAVAPTCTQAGKTEGSHCKTCGTTLVTQRNVPALGHVYNSPSYKWATGGKTCTASRACSRCSHEESESGSISSTVAIDPTCTAKGTSTYTATFANKAFETKTKNVVDIAPLGHDYRTHKVVAPTCTKGGYTQYKCSRCDSYKTGNTTEKLGHDYRAKSVLAPTCTKGGYTTFECSRCEATKVDDYTKATGHHYGNYASDGNATCTKDGTKTRKCRDCTSRETIADEGSALGHDYTTLVAVEPDCTHKGLTEGSHCSRCGLVHVAQRAIPATGHTIVIDRAVPATRAACGWSKGSHCSKCGKVFKKQVKIPKLKPVRISCKNTFRSVSYRTLKKKAAALKIKATATNGKRVSFKKTSGSKRISISKAGCLTVKKGTKRGMYTAKVKLTAGAASKTVKVKVRVK